MKEMKSSFIPGKSRCGHQNLVAFIFQHHHLTFAVGITSANTIIKWINEFLIGFAQDTSLRVYIAFAIFCFLAGDLSAFLVPFRTIPDVLRQCR